MCVEYIVYSGHLSRQIKTKHERRHTLAQYWVVHFNDNRREKSSYAQHAFRTTSFLCGYLTDTFAIPRDRFNWKIVVVAEALLSRRDGVNSSHGRDRTADSFKLIC